jgi:hypothetical protein
MNTGYSQNAEDEFIKKNTKDIMVSLGVFVDDAARLAGMYCLHSNRIEVSEDDMIMALKVRSYNNDHFWNRADINERIHEMKGIIDEEMDEDDIDEDDIDEDMEDCTKECMDENIEDNYDTMKEMEMEEMEMEEMEEFSRNNCTCALCTEMNNIDTKWNVWNPENPIEKSIKKTIDEMTL